MGEPGCEPTGEKFILMISSRIRRKIVGSRIKEKREREESCRRQKIKLLHTKKGDNQMAYES